MILDHIYSNFLMLNLGRMQMIKCLEILHVALMTDFETSMKFLQNKNLDIFNFLPFDASLDFFNFPLFSKVDFYLFK